MRPTGIALNRTVVAAVIALLAGSLPALAQETGAATASPMAEARRTVFLVPDSKRPALNTRIDKKGHPPRGDSPSAPAVDKPMGQANPKDMQWWREARFGMFVHWGPVSLKGTEIGWSRGDQVPTEVYDQLYREFNPTGFNADDWVSVAKAAGMKYLVFTTKHHDGFCEWDTKFTGYNIMNTPFHRDVVKELAAACRSQGVVFGIYHSICDWRHPDYPLGSPGGKTQKPAPNMDHYNAYLKNQLAELIGNYGPFGVLWFDGEWESPWTYERGVDLNNYVRALQPGILINNRVGKGRAGMAGTTQDPARQPGDYDTPEQQVGKFQNDRPWESCITICRQWAWRPDDPMKSMKECLRTLITCAGGDGNLLLNVGPMPDGRIEPRQVERLREIGQWLGRYGRTIYATRGGPFKPGPWGASTFTGNTVYLHLFDLNRPRLSLPPIARTIVGSTVLTGGTAEVGQTPNGITLMLPQASLQDISTIVELRLDGPAADIPSVEVPSEFQAAGQSTR